MAFATVHDHAVLFTLRDGAGFHELVSPALVAMLD
jgi:hypothetical protein